MSRVLSGYFVSTKIKNNQLTYLVKEIDNSTPKKFSTNTNIYSGFNIQLYKDKESTLEIFFYDKKFNAKGIKGNLKKEGFIWVANNYYDFGSMNYIFTLHPEHKEQNNQIKRLFKYFRKYI